MGNIINPYRFGGSSDPDVADWISRVDTNGGALLAAEESAMETFVTALKSNGYWDDITTLHCFCGDSPSAAKTYVKGGTDLTNQGSVDMLHSSRYARETGFCFSSGDYVYEAVFSMGFSFDWESTPDRPLSFIMWGRNSALGARLGIHPAKYGTNHFFGYHESAYGYGFYMKARKISGGTQETGWSGPDQHDLTSVGFAFDGAREYIGRSRDAKDGTQGGSSITLSGDTRNMTGLLYYGADNPRLGVMTFDDLELASSDLDTLNELVCNFVDDCGLTLTAVDPRA
jgi:hypothetical protein